VEADSICEDDVRCYRLDLAAVRNAIANALGVDSEPGPVREIARTFPLGNWQPLAGVALPGYLMFPPSLSLLNAELNRLLLAAGDGFILLVPVLPRIDQAMRDLLDQKKAAVLALSEVVAWDESGFCATPAWQTYRDAYCAGYLADRMVPAQPNYQFARKGMWAIRFAGRETFLDGTLKGPVFIRYLLERQGQEVHVARMLADIVGDDRLAQASDAGVAISSEDIARLRKRNDELKEEREEADDWNDQGRLHEIDKEINAMASYLAPLVGLGGKPRKDGDEVARIRKAISRVIGIALEKIAENDPALEQHLQKSIKVSVPRSGAFQWLAGFAAQRSGRNGSICLIGVAGRRRIRSWR